MLPNELTNAMAIAESQREKMAVLQDRVHSILNTYRNSFTAFLENPRAFDPNFDANKMAMRPGWQQKSYYKRMSESLLEAATQAMLVGERFHMGESIRIAVQVAPVKEQVTIEGVRLPELEAGGAPAMNQMCTCKHVYGYHLDGEKGPCLEWGCDCKHFEPKG